MAEPITAIYVQQDDDWSVTVSGGDKTLKRHAPGIIAARDSVDQLVDELGATAKGATVVHLLNGSALEFTAAYMTARLTRPEMAPLEVPAQDADEKAESGEAVPEQQKDESAGKPKNKAARKAKLTADIGDAMESAKLPAASGSVTVAKATVPSARS
ncbi:hypothetical protein FPZ12_014580 [Amycolatopsis acidicola]|uniref:Uncharacterized protein n=1 Tax=Amycolatopsis acidicola TaxID=2596893 RepID=A0A5N0V4Q5_9PSEU|nr:hypothetical protein [Amycolatopsis acidicola]KAA9161366.1 hypothetical protein FPZ12_014580 [Amycolatopsis acidicola]